MTAKHNADKAKFLVNVAERMIKMTSLLKTIQEPKVEFLVADFIVVQADGDDAGFLLDCARALAGPLVAKLNFYKLRAKVTVESLAETMGALALWDADAAPGRQPGAPWFPDPRLGALGWRAIAPPALAAELAEAQGAALVDDAAYEAHRIALGVPRGGCDFAYGDAFPHEADMDQLNGVAFDKGCYVGQEVVSRMQHRGNVRNRVVPVRIDGAAPAPGTPVVVGDKTVGAVGSAADGRGLALLRLDRVADAMGAGLSLLAGTAELHPVKPAWAKFPWPDAAKAAE